MPQAATVTTWIRRTYDACDRPRGWDWWIHVDQPGHRRLSWSSLADGPALPNLEMAIAELSLYLAEVEAALTTP